jgi:hypothetical protein
MTGMKTVKSALCALILSLGLATATLPETAEADSLVSVKIGDISTGNILSDNRTTVGVAANTALQVCGIQVQAGVLAAFLDQYGSFKCSNNATQKFLQVTK